MTDLFQLPENRPLWKQIQDVLEDLIISHSLEPGARILEQELSDNFGVSRGPVREAIRSLQMDGWLEVHARQGTFVKKPDPIEMEQLFEVRGHLEALAGALAAHKIQDSKLDELQGIVDEGFLAIEVDDIPKAIRLNTKFHRAIAETAGNQVLSSFLEQLEKKIGWYLSMLDLRIQTGWAEHNDVINALKEKDADKCSKILARHSKATFEAHHELLEAKLE